MGRSFADIILILIQMNDAFDRADAHRFGFNAGVWTPGASATSIIASRSCTTWATVPNGIGAVAKFIGDHAGDFSGIPVKGPWKYFTYQRGPFFERPVQQWEGPANLTGYFVPFLTSLLLRRP